MLLAWRQDTLQPSGPAELPAGPLGSHAWVAGGLSPSCSSPCFSPVPAGLKGKGEALGLIWGLHVLFIFAL